MEQVYKNIVESFGALWHCIPRGNTIEVVTPYATTNSKFVSVFITKQGNDYIVTDGGWCYTNEYDYEQNDAKAYGRLLEYFTREYKIKCLVATNGISYYYKTTPNQSLIPNLVFDLCNFISSIINASFVSFEDIKERATQERFKSSVNNYISAIVPQKNHAFGGRVDQRHQDITFNAVITHSPTNLTVVSYITGSTTAYFRSSLAKANLNINIIKGSGSASFIDNYIAVIDDRAKGIEKGSYYVALQNNTGEDRTIDWTMRERLEGLIHVS